MFAQDTKSGGATTPADSAERDTKESDTEVTFSEPLKVQKNLLGLIFIYD